MPIFECLSGYDNPRSHLKLTAKVLLRHKLPSTPEAAASNAVGLHMKETDKAAKTMSR